MWQIDEISRQLYQHAVTGDLIIRPEQEEALLRGLRKLRIVVYDRFPERGTGLLLMSFKRAADIDTIQPGQSHRLNKEERRRLEDVKGFLQDYTGVIYKRPLVSKIIEELTGRLQTERAYNLFKWELDELQRLGVRQLNTGKLQRSKKWRR